MALVECVSRSVRRLLGREARSYDGLIMYFFQVFGLVP
jgi:hypothetical protein